MAHICGICGSALARLGDPCPGCNTPFYQALAAAAAKQRTAAHEALRASSQPFDTDAAVAGPGLVGQILECLVELVGHLP